MKNPPTTMSFGGLLYRKINVLEKIRKFWTQMTLRKLKTLLGLSQKHPKISKCSIQSHLRIVTHFYQKTFDTHASGENA